MIKNQLFFVLAKTTPRPRRGVAEVISTLLLVVITVVGAVILTSFIDESFVAGSLNVASGTDTTLKSIKLRSYDTRNGDDLLNYTSVSNKNSLFPNYLCRESCNGKPNDIPENGGSDFIILEVENQSLNPVAIKNLYLDNVNHPWDANTVGTDLDASSGPLVDGEFPQDGQFSVVSDVGNTERKQLSNQIAGGQTVRLVIKLDSDNGIPDIDLGKTMRVQLNIGENSLAEFLIESGDRR